MSKLCPTFVQTHIILEHGGWSPGIWDHIPWWPGNERSVDFEVEIPLSSWISSITYRIIESRIASRIASCIASHAKNQRIPDNVFHSCSHSPSPSNTWELFSKDYERRRRKKIKPRSNPELAAPVLASPSMIVKLKEDLLLVPWLSVPLRTPFSFLSLCKCYILYSSML